MRCYPFKVVLVMLCVAAVLPGCAPQQPYYFRNNGDMAHYKGLLDTLDNPNVSEPPNSQVENMPAPWSISRPAPSKLWELTLEETVRIALQNGKVLRSIGGQVQGPPSFLTSNPNGAPTIYDPAIVETDARFGIAAGESLFDPTWTTSLFWERNHEPRNVNQNFAGSLPLELSQDVFQFQTALSKTTPWGAQLSVSNSTSYDLQRDDPTREFASDWQTSFQMEIRQPLLQGAGVEFNEIAGPGAIPGFNQGVLIARVNADIALTSFEGQVRNMVADVESAYWELYYAYRNLDAAVEGRDDSLRTWQKANSLFVNGPKEGSAAFESQALEQYYSFRSAAEQAQLQVYHSESRLRFLMGIAATDGQLIRPKDDPTTAKISFDWSDALCEAMARSVEIREARWRVKQRDLELIASKNYLLPKVDLDARYRWLGLGDHLFDAGNSSISGGALDNLGSGEYQDWHAGIEAQIPLGFRKQISGVLNAELALARDHVKLRETELEVSNQLSYAIRDMEGAYMLTVSNFNRRAAAERKLAAVQAAYDVGGGASGVTFEDVLNAQRSLAQDESDYFRSLTNYAKAISQVHRVKGSLLEYNGVYLTEGPWPAKAYFDARRRARARAAAKEIDYGYSYPKPVSRGPYKQLTGQPMDAEEMPSPPAEGQPPKSPQSPLMPPAKPVPGLTPVQNPMPQAPSLSNGSSGSGESGNAAAAPMWPPSQRSRDLGTSDLSGLTAKGATRSAASDKLDLTGFAPVRDSSVQPAAYRDGGMQGR